MGKTQKVVTTRIPSSQTVQRSGTIKGTTVFWDCRGGGGKNKKITTIFFQYRGGDERIKELLLHFPYT